MIVHGHCAGYLTTDENYVVFAIFERAGENHLAVEAVPIEEMERAEKWGKTFAAFILEMLNCLDGEEE